MLQVLHRRIQAPAVAGELLGDDAVQRLRREAFGILRGQKRVKIRRAAPREAARQLLQTLREIAQLARERPVLQKRVELQAQVLRARLFRAAQIPVVAEKYERILRDIVRRRGQLRVDQCQIAVGSRKRQPRLQLFAVSLQRFDERLVGRFAAALPRDERRQIVAQPRAPAGMQIRDAFGDRQQDRFVRIFGAPLRHGVKIAHRVHFVAEKFRAHRLRRGRRKDVQNTAAQRELPHALHERRAGIPRRRDPREQVVHVKHRAGAQRNRRGKQRRARHRAQRKRLKRCHDHLCLPRRQRVQQPQALVLPLARDARRVVKREHPPRQQLRRAVQHRRQLRLHALRRQIVLTENERGALGIRQQRGNDMAAADLADARHRNGLPRRERGEQLLIVRQSRKRFEQDGHRETSVKVQE